MNTNQQHDYEVATTTTNLSEILGQGATWSVTNAARKFLKARERVLKNKHPSALDELKEVSREAKRTCEGLMYAFQCDLDSEKVVEEFIGLNREWTVSAQKVADFANENGISNERAREALTATMARAQMSSLDNRASLISLYEAWLSDLNPQDHTSDEIDSIIEGTVIQAYKRAGEWMRKDEAILIEGAANDLGVLLPKWADVLPNGNGLDKVRQRIAMAVDNAVESKSKALIEAARMIEGTDW